jgi:hypothetical protein
MKNDLVELSNILDEHIEKGESLDLSERRRTTSKIDQYEEVISKGLTFDPFSPRTMTAESPYYNPYLQHPDGGFMPHPEETWIAGRAGTQGYETVREFYRITGDGEMDADYHRPKVIAQASRSQFARFSKSIDSFVEDGETIMKGAKVPVGTTHTFADGNTYKKLAEGKWAPVAGVESHATRRLLAHEDPKVRQQANDQLEVHAGHKMKINELIKQKKKEDEVVGRAKNEAVQAAASHTKQMMDKMYDGKPPKHLEEAHKKIMGDHGADLDPKATLEKEGEKLKPKTHHVAVKFTHQGKEYNHKFENVHGTSHQDAIARVQEILKQKLPGHQLTGVRAETPKQVEQKPPQRREANA